MTNTRERNGGDPTFVFVVVAALLFLLLVMFFEVDTTALHITLPDPEPEVVTETPASAEPEAHAEPVDVAPEPDQQEVLRLAIAIYREAGGDAVCDRCRYRVGDVVLNRVADPRYPDTIEQVLTQHGQYGTMYWDGVVWPARASKPEERHAVERALDTAYDLLAGNHSDLYEQGYIYQSEFPDLGNHATQCCGIYYAKG